MLENLSDDSLTVSFVEMKESEDGSKVKAKDVDR